MSNFLSTSNSPWQTNTISSNAQYGRKTGLIVGSGNSALDLSKLEIEFRTTQADFNAPSTALIRIFNPSPNTINKIQKEFTAVALQAGYVNGPFGVIFNGQILQTKTGKLDNVTRFLDMMCADGSLYHNFGFVNSTVAANASNQDQLNATKQALSNANVTVDPNANTTISQTGGILPRGKVLYGLGSLYNDQLADKTGSSWYIEDGKLNFVPLNGYKPGEAVVINSTTGMIGVPETTEQGIMVRCLLNPKLKLAMKVQLNNNEITTTTVKQLGGYPTYTSIPLYATLNPSGIYRLIVKEHMGQSRGNAFYSNLICLNIDASSNQVQTYG